MPDHTAVDSQEALDLLLTLQRSQELLLEMVADLYEVAQALGPKAGVSLVPASAIREWQRARSSAETVKRRLKH